MKRRVWLFVLVCLCSLALASPLYDQDSLMLQLDVQGEFELVPENSLSRAKSASAQLLLFPKDGFRQTVLEIDHTGEVKDDHILFEWSTPSAGKKGFGYSAFIQTKNQRQEVKKKIPFPIESIDGYEQYTLPTEKIDSNNPSIVHAANELTTGEDDLFKAVFNLAHWVSQNIEYDLNDLTTDVAQPASWVLKNRQGVCDEMTSLFVAMARSQGIPARFVSGISYTESEDVLAAIGDNWAGHGWAEVYFPDVGWVAFDITFDEYGYVDVTHIKLREVLDPDEPATRYKWLADGVDMKTFPLNLDVTVRDRGAVVEDEIVLDQEIVGETVGFGSYNLIRGIVKNTKDYYVATTLRLAVPNEVEVLGKNKRILLLGPGQTKETFWEVKVGDNLKRGFEYSLPTIVYTEKNTSSRGMFFVNEHGALFSQKEIEEMATEDNDFNADIKILCDYPAQVPQGEDVKITCNLQNEGGRQDNVEFCIDRECKVVNVLASEKVEHSHTVGTAGVGWNKVDVTATNEQIEKKISLSLVAVDTPKIGVKTTKPDFVYYGQKIEVAYTLQRDSFVTPKNVVVRLQGLGFENRWDLSSLPEQEILEIEIDNARLAFKNEFTTIITWEDEKGEKQTAIEVFEVVGQGQSVKENLILGVNSILNFLFK